MKKRLVSVALVAALAAGTLAGCGSSSSGDNTQAAAGGETAGKGGSSDENITLRFAWWGGDERNEATLKVIEQFEAAHPNITIEVSTAAAMVTMINWQPSWHPEQQQTLFR